MLRSGSDSDSGQRAFINAAKAALRSVTVSPQGEPPCSPSGKFYSIPCARRMICEIEHCSPLLEAVGGDTKSVLPRT